MPSHCRQAGLIVFFFLASAIFLFTILYSSSLLDDQLSKSTSEDSISCSGWTYEDRLEDLQRILASVRRELADSSRKLEQVNKEIDRVSTDTVSKRAELRALEQEVENAKSVLRDVRDRRNVRVSLPLSPLLPSSSLVLSHPTMDVHSLENIVDFRRCSITTSMRVFVYPSPSSSPIQSALQGSPYAVGEAATACFFVYVHEDPKLKLSDLRYWGERGANHLIINISDTPLNTTTHALIVQEFFDKQPFTQWRRGIDYALHMKDARRRATDDWMKLPSLFPFSRKNLMAMVVRSEWKDLQEEMNGLRQSAAASQDTVLIISCRESQELCSDRSLLKDVFNSSHFSILPPSPFLLSDLSLALQSSSIPFFLSLQHPLPFEDTVDWNAFTLRLPLARIREMHFILRSISVADMLEMKRKGRRVFEEYLANADVLTSTLLASLSQRIGLPPRGIEPVEARPLFNLSFVSPIRTPINLVTYADDEYLGPVEAQFPSPSFTHNYSSLSLYSYARWNTIFSLSGAPEFMESSVEMPTDSEVFEESSMGFRPIEPGSGKEFSLALGGNLPREQFTIVMVTFNRDEVLSASLERLHRCPYLNKVIVVWNNVDRDPPTVWPLLNVPIEFVRVKHNSLNNRFVPWDRIETEAVLSLDDDIDVKQHEIVFAFRVWREERTRIVGFPARYHARFGNEVFYNSNHTCQLSMILTGAAFIHKRYLYAYTFEMPVGIREHVDKVTNCEDIAMNFLVAHLTRKPPLKTTSKWTLKCPTCKDSLWSQSTHLEERHECIRLFTSVYGYNPLRYSQYRVDSVLFKTRIPSDKQKCFRYV